MEKFEFLKSTRFWAIVIAAVAVYLQTKGLIGDPEMVLVATITGGFTAVRTIDRIGDKYLAGAQASTLKGAADKVGA